MRHADFAGIFSNPSSRCVGSRISFFRAKHDAFDDEQFCHVSAQTCQDVRFVIFLVDTPFASDFQQGALHTAAMSFGSHLSNAMENSHCSGVGVVFGGVLPSAKQVDRGDDLEGDAKGHIATEAGIAALGQDYASLWSHHPKAVPIVITGDDNDAEALIRSRAMLKQKVNVVAFEEELATCNGEPSGWLQSSLETGDCSRACVLGLDEMRIAAAWEKVARPRGTHLCSRAFPWQEKTSTLTAAFGSGTTGIVVNLDAFEPFAPGANVDGRLPLTDVFELTRALAYNRVNLSFLQVSADKALRGDTTSIGRAIARIVFNFMRAFD